MNTTINFTSNIVTGGNAMNYTVVKSDPDFPLEIRRYVENGHTYEFVFYLEHCMSPMATSFKEVWSIFHHLSERLEDGETII